MCCDVTLYKYLALGWVNTTGDVHGNSLQSAIGEGLAVMGNSDSMHIDDKEVVIVQLLILGPLSNSAKVVT